MVDASHPSVRQWAAAQPKVSCTDATAVDTDALVTAFADLYAWSHRDWSPVIDAVELMQVSSEEVAQADRALSTATWFDGQMVALALAFPSTDGIEVVAETIHAAQPRGRELVGGLLATLLEKLALRSDSRVHFDGHVTDPHLQPILDRIPAADANPVNLFEIS